MKKLIIVAFVLLFVSACQSNNDTNEKLAIRMNLYHKYHWSGIEINSFKENLYQYNAIIKTDNDEGFYHGVIKFENGNVIILTQEKGIK